MLDVVLYRQGRANRPHFYRVEIAENLFAEACVTREWGLMGGSPQRVISCHGDLREASRAADHHRSRALARGYKRT